MNEILLSQICSVLSTMKGYPNWPPVREDGELSAMDQAYATGLIDLTDDVGRAVVRGVLTKFDERPSVKALREWAVSIAPKPTFDIRSLTSDARALPAPDVSPGEAKRIMDGFKARLKSMDDAGNSPACYGLRFRDRKTNIGQETGCHMTLKQAEAKAADRNARWPHQETTVYHKSDPWPSDLRHVQLPTAEATPHISAAAAERELEEMMA